MQNKDTMELRVGGIDSHFASLEEARDHLRAIHSQSSERKAVRVIVADGDYSLALGLSLSEQDSGTADFPITYCAEFRGKARLLGGPILSDFSPITDAETIERLPAEAREHVLQLDLKRIPIDDFGHFSSRGFSRPIQPAHMELFFADQRMQVARWPAKGWAQIDRPAATNDDEHGGELGGLEEGFYFSDARPNSWRDLDEVWMHGYWGWDWANSYEAIASRDANSGLIRTHPPHGLYGFRAGARFYFLNILEELACPGQYYVDRERGMLYFWPPQEIDIGQGEAAVSFLQEPLLKIVGAHHIHIEGFTLEYGRGSGIEVSASEQVVISNCTVRNIGNHGIDVADGQRCEVLHCEVYHCGDSGISLAGGERETLTPGRHRAADNHIHHIGEWSRSYQPGIRVQGVGQRLEHNHIHDGPHNGILLSGNEHIIEYNHIHHVCQESGDVGAFYMGRDWTECGNVLRYNFFHHTQGVGMGSMAVYLDDCASSTTIFGNIFYQCTRAVFIGGGRNNRVENNIFIDCQPALQIDGRGLDPKPVWRHMVDHTMKERLDAMNYREPPYKTRYPDLKQLAPYYTEEVAIPPEGNLVVRNICCGPWIDIHWHANRKMIAIQNNMIDEDPLFVDREGMDFQLRVDSPAYEIGFKRIPVDKIGTRDNP